MRNISQFSSSQQMHTSTCCQWETKTNLLYCRCWSHWRRRWRIYSGPVFRSAAALSKSDLVLSNSLNRNQVDKRTLIDNLDLLLLSIDEIIDDGYVPMMSA